MGGPDRSPAHICPTCQRELRGIGDYPTVRLDSLSVQFSLTQLLEFSSMAHTGKQGSGKDIHDEDEDSNIAYVTIVEETGEVRYLFANLATPNWVGILPAIS